MAEPGAENQEVPPGVLLSSKAVKKLNEADAMDAQANALLAEIPEGVEIVQDSPEWKKRARAERLKSNAMKNRADVQNGLIK